MRVLVTVLEEPIAVFGDRERTRDVTFVSGAVNANVPATTRGVTGGVYNVGGGSRVSVNEMLEMIGRVGGRRPAMTVDPAQKGGGLEEGLAAEHQWLTGIL